MKVGKIIPCICTQNADFSVDGHAGMPQIKTYGGTDNYFEIYCPRCGRGGLQQFKSVYLALKDWNEMQEGLRMFGCWEEEQ